MLNVLKTLLLCLTLGQGAPVGAQVIQNAPPSLEIKSMQARSYPGSVLTTQQKLGAGRNYQRSVVSYQSDGLRINALLTVPNGAPPAGGWPAIVFNHGFIPPQQYRTTERYVAYVDAFARAGFEVLKPDYRGHGSSQGQPVGTSYWSPEYTVDVLNALTSLKTLKSVNAARIGMWGHSMGGHITLRAMVVNPTIKAGVIWAGVVAPYDLLFTGLPRWGSESPADPRAQLLAKYGRPENNAKAYQAISPNFFLQNLQGRPLQLHHATADTHVPYRFSQVLAAALKQAKQPHTLFTYANDNHDLSNNLTLALARSVSFFKQNL